MLNLKLCCGLNFFLNELINLIASGAMDQTHLIYIVFTKVCEQGNTLKALVGPSNAFC